MTVKDKIVIKKDKTMDVEDKYPQTCDGFQEITRHMYGLFLKKQADYGPSNIGMGKDTPPLHVDNTNVLNSELERPGGNALGELYTKIFYISSNIYI